MFTAAPFTTVKKWEQPKCSLTNREDIDIHNGILLSHKKNKIMPFAATWRDLKIVILSDVRHRKTTITCYQFYVESKTKVQKNLFTKHR